MSVFDYAAISGNLDILHHLITKYKVDPEHSTKVLNNHLL